jgi:hypothetical protein
METIDLILIDKGVTLTLKGSLDGFCGTAFASSEDIQKNDIKPEDMEKGIKLMSRKELRDLHKRAGGNPEDIPEGS